MAGKTRFEKAVYADISFDYLARNDIDNIEFVLETKGTFPFFIAKAFDASYPTYFFYVRSSGSFREDTLEIISDLSQAGASKQMQELFVELRRQKIYYVRFDADGGEIEGNQFKKQ